MFSHYWKEYVLCYYSLIEKWLFEIPYRKIREYVIFHYLLLRYLFGLLNYYIYINIFTAKIHDSNSILPPSQCLDDLSVRPIVPNIFAGSYQLAKYLAEILCYSYDISTAMQLTVPNMTVCSCHVTYAFSEWIHTLGQFGQMVECSFKN